MFGHLCPFCVTQGSSYPCLPRGSVGLDHAVAVVVEVVADPVRHAGVVVVAPVRLEGVTSRTEGDTTASRIVVAVAAQEASDRERGVPRPHARRRLAVPITIIVPGVGSQIGIGPAIGTALTRIGLAAQVDTGVAGASPAVRSRAAVGVRHAPFRTRLVVRDAHATDALVHRTRLVVRARVRVVGNAAHAVRRIADVIGAGVAVVRAHFRRIHAGAAGARVVGALVVVVADHIGAVDADTFLARLRTIAGTAVAARRTVVVRREALAVRRIADVGHTCGVGQARLREVPGLADAVVTRLHTIAGVVVRALRVVRASARRAVADLDAVVVVVDVTTAELGAAEPILGSDRAVLPRFAIAHLDEFATAPDRPARGTFLEDHRGVFLGTALVFEVAAVAAADRRVAVGIVDVGTARDRRAVAVVRHPAAVAILSRRAVADVGRDHLLTGAVHGTARERRAAIILLGEPARVARAVLSGRARRTRCTVAELTRDIRRAADRTARVGAAQSDELADRTRIARAVLSGRAVADHAHEVDLRIIEDVVVGEGFVVVSSSVVDARLEDEAAVRASAFFEAGLQRGVPGHAVVSRRTLRPGVALGSRRTRGARLTITPRDRVATRTRERVAPLPVSGRGARLAVLAIAHRHGLVAARERRAPIDLVPERAALPVRAVADAEREVAVVERRREVAADLHAGARLVRGDVAEVEVDQRRRLGLRTGFLGVVVVFGGARAREPHEQGRDTHEDDAVVLLS